MREPLKSTRETTARRVGGLYWRGLMIMRFIAALVLGLVLVACSSGPPAVESPAKPNIVVILADDLGYGDVSANGGTVIDTPNIDALAAQGVRLTDGYVAHPVCSPSRAGFYTGRYQQRFGFEYNVAGRDTQIGLPTDQTTIANVLKDAGYATGLVGKWHQGKKREYHPMSRGFDEYFGMLAGGSTYIDSRLPGVESWPVENAPTTRSDANAIFDGFEQIEVEEYITDVFADKAVDFIDRHKDKPFFLMMTPNTPHTPLQATKKYTDRYKHIEALNERIYAGMVSSLDDMVGAVTAKLRDAGLEENTLVVFFSDNGCAGYVNGACSNGPLNGFKRYHWEGGIRIPFILRWPERLPAGTTYAQPAISLDLFATFAAAAGSAATAQDGVNLLPYLRGENNDAPHEYLFWRAKPNHAVRWGNWKMWKIRKSAQKLEESNDSTGRLPAKDYEWDAPLGYLTLLYDLSNDIGERTNVADENPEIVKQLEDAWAKWDAELVDPSWPPNRSALREIDGEVVQLFF